MIYFVPFIDNFEGSPFFNYKLYHQFQLFWCNTHFSDIIYLWVVIFHYMLFVCNHQKDKIAHVLLDPVAEYVYIPDLNTRLRVGWKCYLTWISNSNLNFKTKIFPVLPGNQGFWYIDSKGNSNEKNKAMIWSLGESTSWSKGGIEGF